LHSQSATKSHRRILFPEATLHEILIFGQDRQIILRGVVPDVSFIGLPQTNLPNGHCIASRLPQLPPPAPAATERPRGTSSSVEYGMIGLSRRVLQAGPDVSQFQVGEVFEDLRFTGTFREHFEHILYPDAHPADAGTSAALPGIVSDAIKVLHELESTGTKRMTQVGASD
jgi:hypothetical protein